MGRGGVSQRSAVIGQRGGDVRYRSAHESWPPLHQREVGSGEGLAHEGEGFGAAEVVVAGVGRAALPLGGFRGADEFGLVFLVKVAAGLDDDDAVVAPLAPLAYFGESFAVLGRAVFAETGGWRFLRARFTTS